VRLALIREAKALLLSDRSAQEIKRPAHDIAVRHQLRSPKQAQRSEEAIDVGGQPALRK
jgi:hypothetical protein